MSDYPIIIAGSGIAGSSAAIYAGRANNNPLVIHGDEPGGQLTLTTEVANYPGFPDSINGTELVSNIQSQAEKFEADYVNGEIISVTKGTDEFTVETASGEEYTSDAFICASGASARTLEIDGEEKYMGQGLSTCATCDGAFFRGEDMVVVGGGDAAFEEAVFLTKFADTVYIIHRRDEFRAEDYLVDKVEEKVDNGEIEVITNSEVVEILGDSTQVTGIELVAHPNGHPTSKLDDPEYSVEEKQLSCGAVFYAIGHTPNTSYLEPMDVELDDRGYLKTKQTTGSGQTKTGVSGLFGAGDVVDHHYQQAATAAGMGVKAAIDADDYLSEN